MKRTKEIWFTDKQERHKIVGILDHLGIKYHLNDVWLPDGIEDDEIVYVYRNGSRFRRQGWWYVIRVLPNSS
mgnify:CR=1 FL=1